ncbi:MAG: histidine kinase [Saprospiraceae bacterium]|nr:histidine kinase [Saprospiraceae bacterium]
MTRASGKKLVWISVGAAVFLLFYWLFRLAMPGAELAFASGTTAIIMSGLLSGYYLANLWHKPSRKGFNTTVFSLIGLLILCLFLFGLFINKMINNTQFNYFFYTIIVLFLINIFLSMLVGLVRNRVKNNLQSARTALAQSKTELQLMQAQFSPHFLFNTLNNLYGLSITEHQKVPELLLKLSALLRYSVYEVKETFVPLQDELNYLYNYIEFEKIRLGERLSLTLEFEDVRDKSMLIAPILLITFVENAFKHSKNNEDEKIYIHMVLKTTPDAIIFSVRNSYTPQKSPLVHSGFGLESVKKRLNLLYHDGYDLKITKSENVFFIMLTLKNPLK